MIRVVAIASLLGLLVLVLYLPAAHTPERFLAQLRTEHAIAEAYWGQDSATRVLEHALSLQGTARNATPLPRPASAATTGGVESAVAHEMASVNQRLFDNAYFRSIDALLLLAMFRLALLVAWLPWLLVFAATVLIDGYVVRMVKAREFRHHDPEVFAIAACGAIVVSCGAVVAFVAPISLHPALLPLVPLAVSLLLALALASFHLRA
jgi:hypothetical protein